MKNDEWLTPPEILGKLGPFDLDPCAPVIRPWPTAAEHFTKETAGENALGWMHLKWHGRVWMNPPFGREAHAWVLKLAMHGDGIALLPARTETEMFFDAVWARADAILFLKGRPHFHYVDGTRAAANSGAPICLIAYGAHNAETLRTCGLAGQFVQLRQSEPA